jgi:hypothetical protein
MKQYFQSHLVTTLQPWWVILLLCWLTRGRNNSCEGCSSIGYELWACARRVVDWRYDASKWMRRNNRKCVQIKHCSFFTWHLCMHTICLVWRTWPKYAMCSFCFLISNNTELALTLGCERKLFLPGQQNTKQVQNVFYHFTETPPPQRGGEISGDQVWTGVWPETGSRWELV